MSYPNQTAFLALLKNSEFISQPDKKSIEEKILNEFYTPAKYQQLYQKLQSLSDKQTAILDQSFSENPSLPGQIVHQAQSDQYKKIKAAEDQDRATELDEIEAFLESALKQI